MNDALLPFLVAARWAEFGSLFVLFGTLLFPFYGMRAARPAPSGESLATNAQKVVAIAGTVQALSILAWVAASIASMGDGWTSLGDADFVKAFFLETSFGLLWLGRLVLTALLIGLLLAAKKRLAAPNAPTAVALILTGVLLASQAGIGHPAALPNADKSFVAVGYALHVLGGAAWIGGFWPLRAVLAEAKNDNDAHPYVQFVLARYATMAVIAVSMVVVGAAINLRPQIASFERLVSTPWGWAAACKIALFGVLIAIACRNRFVLTPLFSRQPLAASRELFRNVVVDQALALAVLAAAAAMGIMSPSG